MKNVLYLRRLFEHVDAKKLHRLAAFGFFCATQRICMKICGNMRHFSKKSKICAYSSIAKICAKYAHKSKNMRKICAEVKNMCKICAKIEKHVQNMRKNQEICAKYAQICANMRILGKMANMRKICANMRSAYSPPPLHQR